jgi:hypothetical protein
MLMLMLMVMVVMVMVMAMVMVMVMVIVIAYASLQLVAQDGATLCVLRLAIRRGSRRVVVRVDRLRRGVVLQGVLAVVARVGGGGPPPWPTQAESRRDLRR